MVQPFPEVPLDILYLIFYQLDVESLGKVSTVRQKTSRYHVIC